MDERDLIKINERIGEAEQSADDKYLSGVLADELVFRNARGIVATKTEFLKNVENNKFERESKYIKVTFDEEKKIALVILIVLAKGSEFRNLRVFERRATGWQCIVWFNTKLS